MAKSTSKHRKDTNKKSAANSSNAGPIPFLKSTERCIINDTLPTEILSYIFELGTHLEEDDYDFDFRIVEIDPEDEEEGEGGEREDKMSVEEQELDEKEIVDDNDTLSSASSWETEDSEGHNDHFASRRRKGDVGLEYHEDVEFPILVSHVCQRWREIALGNPSLWSTIEFEGGDLLEKNKTFLQRAQRVPLYIHIDCSIDDDDRDDEDEEILSRVETAREHYLYVDLQKFLEVVKTHASHFRLLEVMVSHYVLMQLVLETFGSSSPAPMLEVLQLYFYEDADASVTFEPAQFREQNFLLFNGQIPKLSSVALWGVHLDWERSTFLSGLTDLELAYHPVDVRPPYRDFLRILRTSPELRCLSLCQSGPAGEPVDWLESLGDSALEPGQDLPLSLTLPVTSLVLAFLPPDYIISLLERLSVPRLEHLALDFDEDDYTSVLERFSNPGLGGTTSRSLLANLEAIKITGLPCEDSKMIGHALSQMQTVREININFNHVSLLWYTLLSRPETVETDSMSSNKVYCPRLDTFTSSGLDGEGIRQVVSEREERGCPLKRVFINEDDEVETDDEEWLEAHLETLDYFEGSDDEEVAIDDDDGMSVFESEEEFDNGDFSELEDGDDDWTDDD